MASAAWRAPASSLAPPPGGTGLVLASMGDGLTPLAGVAVEADALPSGAVTSVARVATSALATFRVGLRPSDVSNAIVSSRA